MRSFVCGLVLSLACFVQGANPRFLVNKQFDPSQLPSMKLWMDAWPVPSGNVSFIPDKSGNGAHFYQPAVTNQPTSYLLANGGHCISFDGVNDWMTNAMVTISNNVTVFAVFRANSMADSTFIFDGNNTMRFALYRDNISRAFDFYTTQNTYLVSTNSTWNTLMISDTSSSSSTYMYNSLSELAFPNSPLAFELSGFTIGARYTVNSPYWGQTDIAEIIVCAGILSPYLKVKTMQYLANKWRDMTPAPTILSRFPGLHFWADAWSLSAGPVSTWPDLANSSSNMVALGVTNQPVSIATTNGGHYVAFDGVNDYLYKTLNAFTDRTVCAYFRVNTLPTSSYRTVIGAGGTGGWNEIYVTTSSFAYVKAGGGVTLVSRNTNWNAMVLTTSDSAYLYALINSTALSTIQDPVSSISRYVNFGREYNAPGTFANCDIAEVAIYNRPLGLVEMTAVYNYLTNKWNNPVPSYTSPDQISGLTVWADDTGLPDSGNVTTWTNRITPGVGNFSAINAPAVVTNFNGRKVVTFDGINDYMTNSLAVTQAYTLFAVARLASYSSGEKDIFSGVNGTAYGALYTDGTSIKYNAGASRIVLPIGYAWHAYGITVSGSGSTYILDSQINSALGDVGAHNIAGFTLGANYGGSYPANCEIAAFMLYNRALNSTEKAYVQNYLLTNYNIGLDSYTSPMQLNGLTVWVDETGLPASGNVTTWTNNASPGTGDFIGGATPPIIGTSTLNGKKSVSFDGINSSMTNAFVVAQPYTVYMVARTLGVVGISAQYLMDGVTSSNRLQFSRRRDTGNYGLSLGSTIGQLYKTNSVWNVVGLGLNGASSTYRFNNDVESTVVSSPGAQSLVGLTLAGNYATTDFKEKVNFTEILVYNRELSVAERAWVQNYLLLKYGLDLNHITDPTQLGGAVVWVDGSTLTTTNSLARWTNSATPGYGDFFGSVNPPAVSKTLNGLNVVSFDGVDDYMTNVLSSIVQPYEIYLTFRLNNASSIHNRHIIDGIDINGRANVLAITDGKFYMSAGSSQIMFATNAVWNAIGVVVNNASSLWLTNVYTNAFSASIGTNVATGITLGNRYTFDTPGQADIAELSIFNRALAPTERVWMQNHMINKFDLTTVAVDTDGITVDSTTVTTDAK